MKHVFLMDPLAGVKPQKDTTLALMVGAHRKGYQTYYLPKGGITRQDGHCSLHLTKVIPQYDPKQPFILEQDIVLSENDVDVIWIRTDPPFDADYLHHTWMLDLLPDTVAVINRPSGVRTVNEKIWVTQFTELIPPTLVGRHQADLKAFLQEHQDIIVKPTSGFGGQGIFRLHGDDVNVNVTFELLTDHFTRDIIAQRYIPEAAQGDKRILLLDGDPLGAVLRVHGQDDHRNNFFSGGQPHPAQLTDRDREVIAALKPHLQKLGLSFVGIDMLGDHLIEVNVTSPTCLQEMNRIAGVTLEDQIIAFSDKVVDLCRSNAKIKLA